MIIRRIILFVAFLVLMATTVRGGEYTVDGNTLALYHMNDAAGVVATDETGTYDMNFKGAGEPLWSTSGKYSGAVLFDGVNDYITHASLLDTSIPDGTIDFWFKPNETMDATGDTAVLLSKRNDLTGFQRHTTFFILGAGFGANSGKMRFAVSDIASENFIFSDVATWDINTWYHVAGSWGAAGMKLYVNGIINGTNPFTGHMGDGTTRDFYVGSDNTAFPFNGTIDELRVSDIQRDTFGGSSITIVSPENKTYFNTVWINVTSSFNARWCYSEVDGHNVTMSNSSMVSFYLLNDTLDAGAHKVDVWCNDTLGKWFNSSYVYFTISTPPIASNYKAQPASGRTYPQGPSQFNVTWATPYSIKGAFIEANFSGAMVNYTMGNVSDEYFYNTTEWSAGNYVYRFFGNDTMGVSNTSSWKIYVIQRAASNIALSANPEWSLGSSQSVTITCTATSGVKLFSSGVLVANPYTFTPTFGSYNMTCYLNDAINYTPVSAQNYLSIGGSGFGCTSNRTFAFSKSYTNVSGTVKTINMTLAVRNGHTKADMSDVYVGVWNASINLTGGYYLNVNVTGLTNLTVKFGNYMTNYTRKLTKMSGNISSILGYSEINSYYLMNMYDEISGLGALPPGSNMTITALCSLGQTTFPINDTHILIPSFDTKLDEIRMTVIYTGDYYTRNMLISNPVESLNIYLADAYTQTVLQIPIYIDDYSFYNSKITLYKVNAGVPYTITNGYFDVEHKFVSYLIKDEKYYIRIEKTGETRDLGFLYPATATAQYLTINTISLRPDISLISNNLLMSAVNGSDFIQVHYEDKTNQTSSVQILIYQGTNQTAMWSSTYTANNNITVTISPLNMSKRYSVRFIINHPVYGNSPVEFAIGVGMFGGLIDLGISTWLYPIFAFIMMLTTAMLIHPKARLGGLVFMVIILGVMIWGRWLEFASGVLAVIVIFIIITIVHEAKRGGMT